MYITSVEYYTRMNFSNFKKTKIHFQKNMSEDYLLLNIIITYVSYGKNYLIVKYFFFFRID